MPTLRPLATQTPILLWPQNEGIVVVPFAVKNIGKPCAGKPHARFDEGGQGNTCSLLYPVRFTVPAGVN
jgi:hypothetical protein